MKRPSTRNGKLEMCSHLVRQDGQLRPPRLTGVGRHRLEGRVLAEGRGGQDPRPEPPEWVLLGVDVAAGPRRALGVYAARQPTPGRRACRRETRSSSSFWVSPEKHSTKNVGRHTSSRLLASGLYVKELQKGLISKYFFFGNEGPVHVATSRKQDVSRSAHTRRKVVRNRFDCWSKKRRFHRFKRVQLDKITVNLNALTIS